MPNIVVIDEDAAMRSLITEWLESEGHEVQNLAALSADSGASPCDLVVFSIGQLRARGVETVREVRALYPKVALIALSTQLSSGSDPASTLAMKLGVNRLLAKPLARNELLAAVATFLDAAA